jgi:hypothetical protein
MTDVLATADIQVNGDRPWDIQVKNRDLFDRASSSGSLGFGEAYMDGWWECESLDQFFFKLLHQGIDRKFRTNPPAIADQAFDTWSHAAVIPRVQGFPMILIPSRVQPEKKQSCQTGPKRAPFVTLNKVTAVSR